jgi:hypothetical protein
MYHMHTYMYMVHRGSWVIALVMVPMLADGEIRNLSSDDVILTSVVIA